MNPVFDGAGNASLVELAWTMTSLLGTTVSLSLYRDSLYARSRMRDRGINGVNERIASREVREQRTRTILSFFFTFSGLLFLFVPPIDGGSTVTHFAVIYITLAFLLAQAVSVWNSVLAKRDRDYVLRELLGPHYRLRYYRRYKGEARDSQAK